MARGTLEAQRALPSGVRRRETELGVQDTSVFQDRPYTASLLGPKIAARVRNGGSEGGSTLGGGAAGGPGSLVKGTLGPGNIAK